MVNVAFFASSRKKIKMGDDNKLAVVALFGTITIKNKNAKITSLLLLPIFALSKKKKKKKKSNGSKLVVVTLFVIITTKEKKKRHQQACGCRLLCFNLKEGKFGQ